MVPLNVSASSGVNCTVTPSFHFKQEAFPWRHAQQSRRFHAASNSSISRAQDNTQATLDLHSVQKSTMKPKIFFLLAVACAAIGNATCPSSEDRSDEEYEVVSASPSHALTAEQLQSESSAESDTLSDTQLNPAAQESAARMHDPIAASICKAIEVLLQKASPNDVQTTLKHYRRALISDNSLDAKKWQAVLCLTQSDFYSANTQPFSLKHVEAAALFLGNSPLRLLSKLWPNSNELCRKQSHQLPNGTCISVSNLTLLMLHISQAPFYAAAVAAGSDLTAIYARAIEGWLQLQHANRTHFELWKSVWTHAAYRCSDGTLRIVGLPSLFLCAGDMQTGVTLLHRIVACASDTVRARCTAPNNFCMLLVNFLNNAPLFDAFLRDLLFRTTTTTGLADDEAHIAKFEAIFSFHADRLLTCMLKFASLDQNMLPFHVLLKRVSFDTHLNTSFVAPKKEPAVAFMNQHRSGASNDTLFAKLRIDACKSQMPHFECSTAPHSASIAQIFNDIAKDLWRVLNTRNNRSHSSFRPKSNGCTNDATVSKKMHFYGSREFLLHEAFGLAQFFHVEYSDENDFEDDGSSIVALSTTSSAWLHV